MKTKTYTLEEIIVILEALRDRQIADYKRTFFNGPEWKITFGDLLDLTHEDLVVPVVAPARKKK